MHRTPSDAEPSSVQVSVQVQMEISRSGINEWISISPERSPAESRDGMIGGGGCVGGQTHDSLLARACWSLMACRRRSFCQPKAWAIPWNLPFHSRDRGLGLSAHWMPTPAHPHLSATSHNQPTRHGKPRAAIHEPPNEHLSGKTRSRRESVGQSSSAGVAAFTWDPLWPGTANKTTSALVGPPSPLCCARCSSGAQPFCMQIPVTACHR